jgi:hypothetical protein
VRHLFALLVLIGVLAGSAAAVDAVAARGEGPVFAWVLLREPGALNELLAAGDVRVLDLRAGGRVAQLYGVSGHLAEGDWATLRLPPGLMLPGCG